ncbi:hypothetical protein, partial [Sulfurimonas sp.]|uniref:thrombospondin type 3 repeat-containing protein n=1 Tax=Sulfurimonas sp. TaxID=2022749 RepID=UPI0019FCF817
VIVTKDWTAGSVNYGYYYSIEEAQAAAESQLSTRSLSPTLLDYHTDYVYYTNAQTLDSYYGTTSYLPSNSDYDIVYSNLVATTSPNGTSAWYATITYKEKKYYSFHYENPTCEFGVFDEELQSCPSPPQDDLDDDNDGIPNKCDPDYVDYLTMDCDADGIPNATDPDIDGDGIPNENDSNPFVAGTDDLDIACRGVDTSQTNSLPFSFSTYRYHSTFEEFRCSALIYNSIYDSVVSLSDINAPYCEYSYCYVHEVKNDCTLDSSWYMPSGGGWVYLPGRTENECNSLVDAVNYSENSFQIPKIDCPGLCYLKKIDDTPPPVDTNQEDTDESMGAVDLNSTSSDLAPLLNAQNTTNKHLDDLKDKTDITNNNLNDLKDTSNSILSTNKDIKSGIDGLKSNSDSSLKNQSDGLSKLASINSAIDGASKKIGTMSDTITGNQVIGNGALSSIDGKMTTNNSLLTDIKDSLSSDGSSPDTSASDGFSDLLSGDSDFIDFVTNQFSDFQTNINSNFIDIETQYANAKSLFDTSLSPPSFSGTYNSSCFSFNVFGKSVVLDMSFLSVVSPVIYFIFMLTFMVLNFRFLLNHLLRGDN